jgi:hypothetical protein
VDWVLECVYGGEGGEVVVAELNFFSFISKRRMTDGGAVVRSTDIRYRADVRCLGEFGHGMNS